MTERVTYHDRSLPCGKDALELIMVGPALDLLITDLRMPEMQGDELARTGPRSGARREGAVSDESRRPPVRDQTRSSAPEEAYLDKPFTRGGLREDIRAVALRPQEFLKSACDDSQPQERSLQEPDRLSSRVRRRLLAEAAARDPRRRESRKTQPSLLLHGFVRKWHDEEAEFMTSSLQDIYAANIVDTVRQPLLLLSADLRVVTANPAFYDLCHFTPAEAERPARV